MGKCWTVEYGLPPDMPYALYVAFDEDLLRAYLADAREWSLNFEGEVTRDTTVENILRMRVGDYTRYLTAHREGPYFGHYVGVTCIDEQEAAFIDMQLE